MDLCYCYFKNHTLSTRIAEHDPSISIIKHSLISTQTLPKSGLYWIEVEEISKESLSAIRELIKKHPQAHVYLFAPQVLHKPLLFKFCFMFGIKDLFDTALSLDTLKPSLPVMIQQAQQTIQTKNTIEFSKNIYAHVPFCCFTQGRLTFVSEKLQEFIGLQDAPSIAQKLPSIEHLKEVIVKPATTHTMTAIETAHHEHWKCFFQLSGTVERFMMTLIPYEKFSTQSLEIQLNHRFEAIEWLKDRLVEKDISHTPLLLSIITIENNQTLYKNFSYLEYHEFLKAFLLKLSNASNFQGYIAHWESDSYLLAYENADFEALASTLELLTEELSHIDETIIPILKTTLWEVKKQSLPHVVNFLDKIIEDSLDAKDTVAQKFRLLSVKNQDMDENQEIHAQLYHCMLNNIPLKLLNIYKGLCIYTGSRVLKIKGNDIYLHCENLQGYAIKQAFETVIHGPTFSHEIHAKIKFIDIKEKFLIVNSLEYLTSSANNRQYTRVQPNIRTPIFATHERNSYQGDILDISLKSLAFRCRQNVYQLAKGTVATLNFKLPDAEADLGFVTLEGKGEVVHTAFLEQSAAMKVVVMLHLDEDNETFLMRYMYERQKELIKELKKVVKQHL